MIIGGGKRGVGASTNAPVTRSFNSSAVFTATFFGISIRETRSSQPSLATSHRADSARDREREGVSAPDGRPPPPSPGSFLRRRSVFLRAVGAAAGVAADDAAPAAASSRLDGDGDGGERTVDSRRTTDARGSPTVKGTQLCTLYSLERASCEAASEAAPAGRAGRRGALSSCASTRRRSGGSDSGSEPTPRRQRSGACTADGVASTCTPGLRATRNIEVAFERGQFLFAVV
jgi:hypothetical protein